jgi:hypothetical protein
MTFIGDLERFFAEVIFPNRVLVGMGLAVVLASLALVAWRRRWDRPLRRHPRRTLAHRGAAGPGARACSLAPRLTTLHPQRTRRSRADDVAGRIRLPGPATTLLSGEFQGADEFHFGEGRAIIAETADGLVLRVEDFSVLNGPDLHVYLSTSPDGYTDAAIDLGKLKATDGSFNYDLPARLDPGSIASVVIWCQPFGVQFALAELEAP